jgi:hypothetical protein
MRFFISVILVALFVTGCSDSKESKSKKDRDFAVSTQRANQELDSKMQADPAFAKDVNDGVMKVITQFAQDAGKVTNPEDAKALVTDACAKLEAEGEKLAKKYPDVKDAIYKFVGKFKAQLQSGIKQAGI